MKPNKLIDGYRCGSFLTPTYRAGDCKRASSSLWEKSAKGRKVAHVTVRAELTEQFEQSLRQLAQLAEQFDNS